MFEVLPSQRLQDGYLWPIDQVNLISLFRLDDLADRCEVYSIDYLRQTGGAGDDQFIFFAAMENVPVFCACPRWQAILVDAGRYVSILREYGKGLSISRR